jgi:hypothetical protein
MKKSNVIKVMAIAASALFLTGCPMGFDFTEPPHQTTAAHKLADIDDTVFPDPKFREYVLTNIDQDKDGILSDKEAYDVTDIDVSYQGIADLKGIACFRNLRELNCVGNYLRELDPSVLPELKSLTCNYNPLTELDVSGNTHLQTLRTADTLLTHLDVSMLNELTYLIVDNEVLATGSEREYIKVIRSTRRSTHPEWETDPEWETEPE